MPTEALFWYWVNERHMIYVRRFERHLPKPWTNDPILQAYKFTNVFRQLDRGTQWLTENFITPHRSEEALLLGNVCWYRMFNWIGTGRRLGWRRQWDSVAVKDVLRHAMKAGEQVFTSAHIVRSAFGQPKIDSIVDVCATLWGRRESLAAIARRDRSLRAVFGSLIEVPYVGGFMAYEIVSDLRHTPLLSDAHDINTWANVGPGAMRGLRRLDPQTRPKAALVMMRDLLARSRACTAEHVPPMELRDIEHSLCEFDKYCRVKFGEGRPRCKYPGVA